MTRIHPAVSVEDAMTMLDTRVPLTHAERRMICQSLYDTGVQEGRTVESARVTREEHGEYTDTTAAIRERLTEKARKRNA